MPTSRPRAKRALDLVWESTVVIELPIARNYRVLVNHKRGKAFRIRTAPAIFRAAFRPTALSRDRYRHRQIAAGRLPSPAQSYHVGRLDRALPGLPASDQFHYR